MTSRLTSKPRVPLFSTGLAAASVALAVTTSACGEPAGVADAGRDVTAAPMPPPQDAASPMLDAYLEVVDARVAPMVDGSLEPVDAAEPPPMPPMPAPLDAAEDPDAGVIAPMPPPMPPPMDPPPMPDPPMPPPPPMPAPKS
jgi:hypothetical protein